VKKWIPALLIIAAVVVSLYMYPSLPDRIPTHFGIDGKPNGWSSRFWGAWLVPLIMALVWLIMRALPHIDPRKANYEKFRGSYEVVVLATLLFMLAMHVVILKAATGTHISMDRFAFIATGAFFMLIGLVLPGIRSNWFVGIKTPWTLTSTESWERTHKVGGTLFVLVGLVGIVSSLLAPRAAVWIFVASAVGITVFLFAYSYRVWKNDPHKHSI
jgi:uncharacterized membrane protein